MAYETVIGLEVHVQLKTRTKVFCGCPTEFGAEPNTQVCPVCLGLPGALPVLNAAALDSAVKVGLALNCSVQGFTKFDRKHYYYPDLPKNFQISQYDLPIAKDGWIEIEGSATTKRISIRRAHLEEDAGKLIHRETSSLVDYNRTGMPLLEIVSEPEISAPEEAYEYLTCLKAIVAYLDVSDCDMEKGSLRCDANVSLRPRGQKELGVKAEVKNLNSFKAVKEALAFEIARQEELLEAGQGIVQETRLWDEKAGRTVSMRSKEEAKDYRYFPEPDLPPFVLSDGHIARIRESIPELPREKKRRFMRAYNLSGYDAGILVSAKKNAAYAEERLAAYPGKEKSVANWIIGPLASLADSLQCEIHQVRVAAADLIELIRMVEEEQAVSNLAGKSVLEKMARTGKTAREIIEQEGLAQVSDKESLEKDIAAAIAENPKAVADIRAGKQNSIMFLVGQVMKKTKGRANPKIVQELLKRRVSDE